MIQLGLVSDCGILGLCCDKCTNHQTPAVKGEWQGGGPQSWHWPPQVRVGQPWAQWVPVAISRERVIYEIFRRCFSKGEWITR